MLAIAAATFFYVHIVAASSELNTLVNDIVALNGDERKQLATATTNFLIQFGACNMHERSVATSENITALAEKLALFNYKSPQEIIELGDALAAAQNRKDLMDEVWNAIHEKGIACEARVIMMFLHTLINNPVLFR